MTDTDHLYLSRPEIRLLIQRLDDLTWMSAELDTVIIRDTQYQDRPEGKAADTPVPFHVGASDLAWELRDCLRQWTNTIATQRHLDWPGDHRAHVYAAWISKHVFDLALVEDAASAADEIHDIHKRIMRMIDRPQDLEFVGPCQSDTDGISCDGIYAQRGADTTKCRTCHITIDIPAVQATTREVLADRLYTATELETALTIFCGRKVTRPTIHRWINADKLKPRPGSNPPVYALDEGAALVAQMRSPRRRKTM